MGEALGGGDPDAQAGEGARPGADHDADQPRAPQVLLAEEPGDRRQQGLAVAVAGGPGGEPVDLAVGRAAGDDDLGRGRVDREDRPAAAVVAHAMASR